MDPEWQEVNQIHLPLSEIDNFGNVQNVDTNIGALAFDTHQELIWIGDQHGHVTSYSTWRLEVYTTFPAHPPDEGAVKQFLFNEKRIFSLAPKSLHCSIRRGLPQWHLTHPTMRDLACMTFLDRGNSILVAGSQNVMLKVNASNGEILQQIPTPSSYMMMRQWRSHLCAATDDGSVDILDLETLTIRKQWKAHSSRIADMDAKNDFLITCGWAPRSQGPAPEPIAKVFNLRTMEQFAPISFPAGASFVQIHPKLETTCLIGSRNGQLQVIDITISDAAPNIRYMLTQIDSLTMSPSGNVWIMADDQNTLHVWAAPDRINFTENSEQTEIADEQEPVPFMQVDTDHPFSTIGMPYYKETLLSAWGGDQVIEVGHSPREVDAELNPTPTKWGLMVENRGTNHRNQVEIPVKPEPNDKHNTHRGVTDKDLLGLYANVRINYGHHGISDFDFQSHNKTHFSGLESDIQHSFLNPLLQLLKYTPCVRNAALAHVAGNCLAPDCLLCELGFLFDSLEKAKGINCQATNFLNTYHSLDLVKVASAKNLDFQIVQATSVLLPRLTYDSHRIVAHDSLLLPLDQVLTINSYVGLHCTRCQTTTQPRLESSQLITLLYTDQGAVGRRSLLTPSFSEVLTQSLIRDSFNKGWCNQCKSYPQLRQRRLYNELPPVLTINALSEQDQSFWNGRWASPGWLPRSIGVVFTPTDGNIRCFEENLDQLSIQARKGDGVYFYDLVGVVARIFSTRDGRSHLVAMINVALAETNPESHQWHLFNDFTVQEISADEALHFDPSFKTPVIVMYQVRYRREVDIDGNPVDYRKLDDSWKTSLDPSCLYDAGSLIPDRGIPLLNTEEHHLIHAAVDAEFVLLEKEQFEITIDGKKKMTRPKRQAIGRVSVVRGGGPKEAMPFVDDYIEVFEPIVDHQTQYSGLEVGDLEYGKSPYHLQSLKVVYRKLWLLLNDNIIFIGHGLVNDFRVLNLFVPKGQTIDTVELFKTPEGRSLSLRYLAWFFLEGEDKYVQTGNHDSIVDARTALRLWQKSEELKQSNIFSEQLQEAYEYGHRTKYLPPDEFKALQQQQQQARIRGGGGLELPSGITTPSGRLTPEFGGSPAPGSGPVTPEAKNRGKGRVRDGDGLGYFASPLR